MNRQKHHRYISTALIATCKQRAYKKLQMFCIKKANVCKQNLSQYARHAGGHLKSLFTDKNQIIFYKWSSIKIKIKHDGQMTKWRIKVVTLLFKSFHLSIISRLRKIIAANSIVNTAEFSKKKSPKLFLLYFFTIF